MTLPVLLRPSADADVESIHDTLQTLQVGLGDQFVSRLRETLERTEANPLSNGVIWQDVRAARLRQFQYQVYFVAFPDRVEVLAVLHGSRADSAWQSRV